MCTCIAAMSCVHPALVGAQLQNVAWRPEVFPASQGVHLVAPGLSENVPDGHHRQRVMACPAERQDVGIWL